MSDEKFKEVIAKASELFKLRDKHTEEKAAVTELWEEVTKRQAQLSEMLLDAGITKVTCPEGTFSLQTKQEFGVEDYDELRKFLLDHNLAHMLTVNANSLQAFCRVEFETKGTLPNGVINKGERTTPHMRKER